MASLRQTARRDQEVPRAARVEPVRVGPRAAGVGADVEAGPIVDRGHGGGGAALTGISAADAGAATPNAIKATVTLSIVWLALLIGAALLMILT